MSSLKPINNMFELTQRAINYERTVLPKVSKKLLKGHLSVASTKYNWIDKES